MRTNSKVETPYLRYIRRIAAFITLSILALLCYIFVHQRNHFTSFKHDVSNQQAEGLRATLHQRMLARVHDLVKISGGAVNIEGYDVVHAALATDLAEFVVRVAVLDCGEGVMVLA
jgi:hypothetical protein